LVICFSAAGTASPAVIGAAEAEMLALTSIAKAAATARRIFFMQYSLLSRFLFGNERLNQTWWMPKSSVAF
jgi:hypothetical protein